MLLYVGFGRGKEGEIKFEEKRMHLIRSAISARPALLSRLPAWLLTKAES